MYIPLHRFPLVSIPLIWSIISLNLFMANLSLLLHSSPTSRLVADALHQLLLGTIGAQDIGSVGDEATTNQTSLAAGTHKAVVMPVAILKRYEACAANAWYRDWFSVRFPWYMYVYMAYLTHLLWASHRPCTVWQRARQSTRHNRASRHGWWIAGQLAWCCSGCRWSTRDATARSCR